MLSRITGGVDGFGKYMQTGERAGRDKHRDELDQRVVLFGDLDQTEALIESMDTDGERYLHITLSFVEDDIDDTTMKNIARDYVEMAMAGYSKEEYCAYAEAHLPKVKSYVTEYEDTGKKIEKERFKHIHLCIPKTNLVTGEPINPFGMVMHHDKHLDAIQEHLNHKYGLISPKDCPRKSFNSASEIISHWQGDIFGKENKELKTQILQSIIDRRIESPEDFKHLLNEFGATRTRNAGKEREYENVKPAGADKGTNLKEYVFSKAFIALPTKKKLEALNAEVERKYVERKESRATPEAIQSIADDWTAFRAKSVRYLSSGKARDDYIEATQVQKSEILKQCEASHRDCFRELYAALEPQQYKPQPTKENQHVNQSKLRTSESNASTVERAATPESASRVSSLPPIDLVPNIGASKVFLPGNASDYLGDGGENGNRDVRRVDEGAGRTGSRAGEREQGLNPVNPATGRRTDSVVSQFRRDRAESKAIAPGESVADIKSIKQDLDAASLLAVLAKSHGLLVEKYAISKAKDGSDRIKVGKQNLNVADFLTKEMHFSWKDAEKLLQVEHSRQQTGQKYDAKPIPINQPRQALWKEFAATRPTPEQRVANREQQKQSEKDRRKIITADYYAAKGVLAAKPTPGKRAAMSLLRMAKLKKEAELKDQIDLERAELRKSSSEIYREWLHNQAINGRETALEELRRMRIDPFPAPKPDDALIKGDPQRCPIYHSLSHVTHSNGDVTYRRDGQDVLRDTVRAVNCIQTDRDTIEAGLRLATAKFGPKLEISGTSEFRQNAARIAAQAGLRVEFSDPELSKIMAQEKEAMDDARQWKQATRVKTIERKDGAAIDQRKDAVPVPVDRRKERIAEKIEFEEKERPVQKTKTLKM